MLPLLLAALAPVIHMYLRSGPPADEGVPGAGVEDGELIDDNGLDFELIDDNGTDFMLLEG